MRKVLCLFLFIFLIFEFGCAENNLAELNEWDFGKIKQGDIVNHDFLFENFMPKVLKITGINTSCGCMVSETAKKSLLPGENTAITVRFNSKGYVGQTKQFIYVNTDNPDMPVVKFVIKAEVQKP